MQPLITACRVSTLTYGLEQQRSALSSDECQRLEQMHDNERHRLMANPGDLVRDIEQGLTAMVVFGRKAFREEAYDCRVGDALLQLPMDHAMAW